MIVIDASVLATALADDGHDGDRARRRLRGERLACPAIVDLEVLSAWRRMVSSGELDQRRSDRAVEDLRRLRADRVSHLPLLRRIWELRGNLTVYDAAYVALAELLATSLLTADRRLASAPTVRCDVEVIE